MDTWIESKPTLARIGKRAYTTSTLEIPIELLGYYKTRCAFFGNRRAYLHHLISAYGRHLDRYGIYPYSPKWKKEYQKKGLGLERCDFVPHPGDWEELRHIAFAYGLSMCKLFVILLKLEQQRWKEAGEPEHFQEKSSQKAKEASSSKARRASRKRKKRNSVHGPRRELQIAKETRANRLSEVGLHRVIEFDELALVRIGWVS